MENDNKEVCPRCNGARQIIVGPPLGTCDGPQMGTCPDCNGSGKAK